MADKERLSIKQQLSSTVSCQVLNCAETKLQFSGGLDNGDKKGSLRSMALTLNQTHHASSTSLWAILVAELPDLDGLILNNREAEYLQSGWKTERSESKGLAHTHSGPAAHHSSGW